MPWIARSQLTRIEGLLEEVLRNQRSAAEKEKQDMAATQADLDTILSTVQTDVATLQAANQSIITKLQSITPGQPAPDFTNEVAQLQTLDAALNALSTADTSAAAGNSGTTDPTAGTATADVAKRKS